jgi:UDP-N-acetylmuramate--alanine ligase
MRHLTERGCQIFVGHRPEQVPPEADLVVYSLGVKPDNVELAQARTLGIPILRRSQMLGRLLEQRTAVGVVGGAGKSTTTTMLGSILAAAGLDPTVYLGAAVPAWDDLNFKTGSGSHFVAELEESDTGFPVIPYALAIVTNVDLLDHPDSLADEAAAIRAL